MGRQRKGRSINGILIVNKPKGITSNSTLQRVKRLFNAAKAGHTGILDPLATGVLPVCFGEATKFSQFILDSDKAYFTTIQLGVSTSTYDCEGEVTARCDASAICETQVDSALDKFRGDIMQVPPMVSALKYQGKPLYKLAREGREVERSPRAVSIYSMQLLEFRSGHVAEADVAVHCSKGTYIRSIADDLGQALACGGHVKHLHRSMAGPFKDEDSVTVEELEDLASDGGFEALDSLLMPADAGLQTLPSVAVDDNSAHYFLHGQAVFYPQVYQVGEQGDKVRVSCLAHGFLGVAEITDDGRIAPRRVFAINAL